MPVALFNPRVEFRRATATATTQISWSNTHVTGIEIRNKKEGRNDDNDDKKMKRNKIMLKEIKHIRRKQKKYKEQIKASERKAAIEKAKNLHKKVEYIEKDKRKKNLITGIDMDSIESKQLKEEMVWKSKVTWAV
ncbi:hypothetical protein ILUMI_08030 [Ignelater luminosus]|uniref:Uncharacterized protein n=1 Tax=Ignelater luminosus TaxID=2038154 RepID=A0A8K0D2D8_IGNLU|nr:hypothetical protein ILUMI_08030 [Ignelater luminosus]